MANIQNLAENTRRECDLYRVAEAMVENQLFTDYDTSEFEWFQLFFDGLDRQWCVEEKVRLVSNKAKAGWSEGYYNEEYLEELPFVMIDADENYKGKYLAFEVDGDSMEPDYLEGDIVICREIQRHLWSSKLHFRDWDFVIAHSTNGIMLKEITAHNIETGDITCHSLNPKYEDFVLNLHQVAHLYNVVEVRQKGRNKRWNRAKDFM